MQEEVLGEALGKEHLLQEHLLRENLLEEILLKGNLIKEALLEEDLPARPVQSFGPQKKNNVSLCKK